MLRQWNPGRPPEKLTVTSKDFNTKINTHWINASTKAKKLEHCILCDFIKLKLNNMFRSKRKDSAIRTLVAETLVLAKTHGYVEKIEHELEEELQRENTEPPNRILAKWRRNGEKLLKNKYTLLTVALFCVTECALILGELILDLHKVKDVLEDQEAASLEFVKGLHELYPDRVPDLDVEISYVYSYILHSTIQWTDSFHIGNQSEMMSANTGYAIAKHNETRHRRSMDYTRTAYVTSYVYNDTWSSSSAPENVTSPHPVGSSIHRGHGSSHGHSLEEEIAHAFHMASITILSILVFETILKALCAGTAFFQRKLETFDLCVVLISFVVDLVCMQIMPRYKIQDFVFILAFLLPWRVIRVVNSLVVAVQDHEHFRLKLIYGRKKKIVNSLRESEIKLQLFRAQCNALKRLCFNEGIDESKIDQILMVEECVVNKAGKSKCKIKIDNSSVILLNDKSDFPRLSPRPSLLNLVEKVGGRRKSMQPQSLSSIDRDVFLNAKESPKKGILKMRGRSNSESGRGTLSSPDDSSVHQNSFGCDGVGMSGLNTPIVVNRKSSLSSPIMANHVRNILNSLEDKVNQMNGSCSRLGGGRGSIDADSIPEEEEVESSRAAAKRWGRRVHSIDETRESSLDFENNGASYASKRRASLQPQRCVDEDDADFAFGGRSLVVPKLNIQSSDTNDQEAASSLSTGDKANAVIGAAEGDGSTKLQTPFKFIPTTIQIDPPSTNSNYSLSTSSSSSNHNSNRNSSSDQPEALSETTLSNGVNNSQIPYMAPVTVHASGMESPYLNSPSAGAQMASTSTPTGSITPTNAQQPHTVTSPTEARAAGDPQSSDKWGPGGHLKPKTLRTASDIENQNNLTFSESSDVCESQSQSNDAGTRNTSIEELDDDFEITDETMVSISNTDDAVLSGSSSRGLGQTSSLPGNAVLERNGGPGQGNVSKSGIAVGNRHATVTNTRRGSLVSKDGSVSSTATDSSVDPPEQESNSVSHLLS